MSFNGARVYSHRKVEILSCAENKYDFALLFLELEIGISKKGNKCCFTSGPKSFSCAKFTSRCNIFLIGICTIG